MSSVFKIVTLLFLNKTCLNQLSDKTKTVEFVAEVSTVVLVVCEAFCQDDLQVFHGFKYSWEIFLLYLSLVLYLVLPICYIFLQSGYINLPLVRSYFIY